MASVASAEYEISFREDRYPSFNIAETIDRFNSSSEIIIEKKTKKGSRELNLKEFVYKLDYFDNNKIFMRLCAGSGTNIKPGLVISELFSMNDDDSFINEDILITRLDLFDTEGKALIEAGEHF